MNPAVTVVGCAIVAASVYAVFRRVDVRLSLLSGALCLGVLTGSVPEIVAKFFTTFVDGKFVVPICSAMGFAYVLRHTECDRHLVHLLTDPLRKVRRFLLPGAVLVGFVVNIPIISQTSSAVAIGSVLIPVLLRAHVPPLLAGAALLLGCSVGGELLNPGAPEYASVREAIQKVGAPAPRLDEMIHAVLPLNLLQLGVAVGVFWALSARELAAVKPAAAAGADEKQFRVALIKAAIPVLPLAILFLTSDAFRILTVPPEWLLSGKETRALIDPSSARAAVETLNNRLIGAAMLVGVIAAMLTDRARAGGAVPAFFQGAGYALAEIVSIIVAASCFGEGVRLIGLDRVVHLVVEAIPGLLIPGAAFMPMAFGALSGSGMAAAQTLAAFFIEPAAAAGVSLLHVGGIVSIGAAAGRTMSPVAAVTLMCARMTECNPTDVARRVVVPLLVSTATVVLVGSLLAAGPWKREPLQQPAAPMASPQ